MRTVVSATDQRMPRSPTVSRKGAARYTATRTARNSFVE
jgi:hypothetical protein